MTGNSQVPKDVLLDNLRQLAPEIFNHTIRLQDEANFHFSAEWKNLESISELIRRGYYERKTRMIIFSNDFILRENQFHPGFSKPFSNFRFFLRPIQYSNVQKQT